jgi:hypothetical protein
MLGRVLTPGPFPTSPGVRRDAGYASRPPEELAHQGPFDLQVRRPLQHAQEMSCPVKGVEVLLDYMLKVKGIMSARSPLNHMLEANEFEIRAKPAE